MSLWRRISASTSLSPEGEQYIAVFGYQTASGHDPNLSLVAYPFDAVNGFGTRIEQTTGFYLVDTYSGGMDFTPSGAALNLAINPTNVNSPIGGTELVSLQWDEGFGSLYTSQPTVVSPSTVEFHPDGDVLFLSDIGGVSYGTRIKAFNWSDSTGAGSEIGSYVTVSNPTQGFVPIAVSPNGNFVAVGYSNSAHLEVYPFNKSTGFGTKQEAPNNTSNTVFDVAWNNAGTYVAVAGNGYDGEHRLNIYEWDNATGTFGSKVSGVSVEPLITTQQAVYTVAFAPDDEAIILGCSVDDVQAYEWDNATGTFGSKYTSPTGTSGFGARDLKFNTNGTVLFASGGQDADYPVAAWEWDSSTGFGAKYDNADSSGYSGTVYFNSLAYIDLG